MMVVSLTGRGCTKAGWPKRMKKFHAAKKKKKQNWDEGPFRSHN